MFIILWLCPFSVETSQFVKFIYYVMAYCLFNTTYTIVYVPYNALTANITDDYDQRSSLTTVRIILANFGMILGAALFGLLAGDNTVFSELFVQAGCTRFEAIKNSYLVSSAIIGLLAVVTMMISGLDATSGASTAAAAGAVRTALAANAAFTNVYATSGSGSDIIVTEKSGHYGAGKPTSSITSTSGTLTGTTTTEPSATVTYNTTDIDTYIDRFGILHVGTTVPVGSVLHVTVETTYDPQSGTRQSATGDFTVTVD